MYNIYIYIYIYICIYMLYIFAKVKVKQSHYRPGRSLRVEGKAIPLQAWTVPEGSQGLRLPDFKTFGPRSW